MRRVELGRVRILILILWRGTDTVTWDLADLALPADGAPLYSMAMGSLHPALRCQSQSLKSLRWVEKGPRASEPPAWAFSIHWWWFWP